MKKESILEVLQILLTAYPNPKTELLHRNPFELLIATLLSAQCTDVRVNMVTPELFAHYPDARSMSEAPLTELEHLIRSINFFRNKALHMKQAAQMLVLLHGGEVPRDRAALEALPGVGRKTANVVLANAFGIPAFAVDTHVHRVTNRIGIVHEKEPLKTEQALMKKIPEDWWIDGHHLFILHGRKMCKAKNPLCSLCPVREYCDFYK